jgi:ferritin
MLDKRMEEALNGQLNAELYSSYLYLSMAAYFDSINLPGFASWMDAQAQEETLHGMKFFHYIQERGGRVLLGPIEGPQTDWDSPEAVFEHVLKHEQKVTGLIHDLVNLSEELKDHATRAFLQWFVSEQVEEESTADSVLQKVRLAGDRGSGIFMLDQELGTRVFTPPTEGES